MPAWPIHAILADSRGGVWLQSISDKMWQDTTGCQGWSCHKRQLHQLSRKDSFTSSCKPMMDLLAPLHCMVGSVASSQQPHLV